MPNIYYVQMLFSLTKFLIHVYISPTSNFEEITFSSKMFDEERSLFENASQKIDKYTFRQENITMLEETKEWLGY